MSLYVCPSAVIDAPCATVWEVLRNIPSDPRWLGVEVDRVAPPGPLQPGQTLETSHFSSQAALKQLLEKGAGMSISVLLIRRD